MRIASCSSPGSPPSNNPHATTEPADPADPEHCESGWTHTSLAIPRSFSEARRSMGSTGTPSSPSFPNLEPIIMDDEMESAFRSANMEFLDPAQLDLAAETAGSDFDDLFSHITSSRQTRPNAGPEPAKPYPNGHPLEQPPTVAADFPVESPDNSSRSSSSESPRNHLRQASTTSTTSNAHSENHSAALGCPSEDWMMRSELASVKDEAPLHIEPSYIMAGNYSMNPDMKMSDKAMDAAFDFESAASSPGPFLTQGQSQRNSQRQPKSPIWSPSSASAVLAPHEVAAPASAAGPSSPFYSFGLKEQSPFSGSAPQWAGQSPSSLLGESFGGINMSGQSPLNPSLSPNMSFGSPSSYPFPANFVSSPAQPQAETANPRRFVLKVQPTSHKSRVETQIPIRLTLSPLPTGVEKLRLPSHTISKLKFLAPSSTEPSPDTLQLSTSLVCTSAMQDTQKRSRAFARARGESQQDDAEVGPLEGGDVKICPGCIQRERKRASRKKQRKPEEDELFQKDEEKRVIVFNTNEIKEWTEVGRDVSAGYNNGPAPPPGTMQVELPMRIACYCRHQTEKIGFQVIFTVKDHLGKVIAQAITNSIMITDDHKAQAPSAPPMGSGHNGEKAKRLASPQSPTDLQGLQQGLNQRFNSQYQLTPSSFAGANGTNGISSNSHTPRNLSRQASPTDFPGPQTKRRKQSSSGRVPSELAMTRLETPASSVSNMASAAQLSIGRGFASPTERPFVTPAAMSGQFTGPPTPNQSNDHNPFFNPTSAERHSLDSLAHQSLASAPNSAQPSRPGTPGALNRNGFHDSSLDLALGANTANTVWPLMNNSHARLPPVIHKIVPAEGSISGGTEVTLLGNQFTQGMEVVFGDTLATTTTYWGEKCLSCLTPPALQPGFVTVGFKHEHPSFSQVQQPRPLMPKQQTLFRYTDDRELQMYRLALSILGQKMGSQKDAFQTAQQIMSNNPNAIFGMQNDISGGGSSGGHQRQVPGLESQGKFSDIDAQMLTFLEFIDLDDSPRSPRYNARNSTGQSLLHLAASLGLTRFVAGLLARGANPEVQDNTGNTPMHLAALHGHAHIVRRLRQTGASASARNIRGFNPADLASTLDVHQAALLPSRHYRSQSAGSLGFRRRQSSSVSLNSLWEASSATGSLGHAVDDSSDLDDYEDSDEADGDPPHLSMSRRSSMHQDVLPVASDPVEQPPNPADARGFFPPAAVILWRDHLAAQIHHFQQSVSNAFPNMPALPPMPALPDYQANQMMRRITNLVPNRPMARDGWWDLLKGTTGQTQTQPPSYDELYPHQEDRQEDAKLKKSGLLRAQAEAVLDQHFEAQSNIASASASTSAAIQRSRPEQDNIKDITIGGKIISREQQKHLREHQARRMKGLASDRNLYFFWIPLLLLVLGAWIRNYVPWIWDGVTDGYDFVKARATQRAVEMGI